jgi:hypothetical protein
MHGVFATQDGVEQLEVERDCLVEVVGVEG